MKQKTIPIVVISGFLGSGKTTLLTQAIRAVQQKGLQPAVIMNELGEVNLDGTVIGAEIPMEEMLSGCICCTIRGDLGIAIKQLVDVSSPDIIFIEATGAANPIEIIDGITEASLYMRVELKDVVTVVDGPQLLSLFKKGKGQSYRLMKEQARCASLLLLNKTDLLSLEERKEVRKLIREVSKAEMLETIRCEMNMQSWVDFLLDESTSHGPLLHVSNHTKEHMEAAEVQHHHDPHHDHDHDSNDDHEHHHPSHRHMLAVTYYLENKKLDSVKFDRFLKSLPEQVYRGKGLVRFADTSGDLFLFQFAYRETDYMKIQPQIEVPEVVVLIGEQLNSKELISGIEQCVCTT